MKYYLPEHGGTAEDAYSLEGELAPFHNSLVAASAAEDFHYRRDGWEVNSWPIVFCLVDDDGVESRWQVDREPRPVFTATELPGSIS